MFKEAQNAVRKFHEVCEHPINDKPTMLNRARFEKRVTWMLEELGELVSAKNFVDQLDGLSDLLYFIFGTFVEMGVDGSEIFQIVHEANMRKQSSRNAKFRHGKTVKPDNWLPPESEISLYLDSIFNTIKETN
jgi:predicted HAD superfamily Cof-like phosphohydrolase